ncbi:hypothetical protein HYH02_006715 [Chlamydomonas schloesseri]|uniref:Uncharacterized protein n=1 Tax=Chlamydomonas schloesseri TaxID=2026947 RepID=A0A836B5H4_9CHLO|nr:hypothetical protein HYH02_006715 [Chlamydomonas schloesseri]|eukprot:KAG2448130.1 hypothetical protein HYH02_006715 [Chlamydomonas schloesseri]
MISAPPAKVDELESSHMDGQGETDASATVHLEAEDRAAPPADRIRILSAAALLSGKTVDLRDLVTAAEALELVTAPPSAGRDLSFKERCALRDLAISSKLEGDGVFSPDHKGYPAATEPGTQQAAASIAGQLLHIEEALQWYAGDFLHDYSTALPSGLLDVIRSLAARSGPAPNACRDVFVLAAQHGDQDMLRLLSQDQVFRRVTSLHNTADAGALRGQRLRDLMLADLVWAMHNGTVLRQMLAWMFADRTGPFADWRASGTPYLTAAVAMQEKRRGATVRSDTYDLDLLHELGFGFASDGRTLLTAVHLASTGRCPLRAVEWLLEKGCPAGQPGLAYACAIGLGPAQGGRAAAAGTGGAVGLVVMQPHPSIDEAVAVMSALHAKGVPLGPPALEDLWRLPLYKYVGYVRWLAEHGCPGLETKPAEHRERLYLQALQLDAADKLSWSDGRAAALRRQGLAPSSARRWAVWAGGSAPACFSAGAEALRSRRVLDPLQDLLSATPMEAVALGGPRFAPGGLPGALSDAYHNSEDNLVAWAAVSGPMSLAAAGMSVRRFPGDLAAIVDAVKASYAASMDELHTHLADATLLTQRIAATRSKCGALAAAAAEAQSKLQAKDDGEPLVTAASQLWLARVCAMLHDKAAAAQLELDGMDDKALVALAHVSRAAEAVVEADNAAADARCVAATAQGKPHLRSKFVDAACLAATHAAGEAQETREHAHRARQAFAVADYEALYEAMCSARKSASMAVQTKLRAVGYARTRPPSPVPSFKYVTIVWNGGHDDRQAPSSPPRRIASPRVSYGGGGCSGGGCGGGYGD